MKYQHAITRALKYKGQERASEVFRALTGINPYQFAINARPYGGPKFCYLCKREADSFKPTCDVSCIIRFNQLSPWQRSDYIRYRFPDALWLSLLNTEKQAYDR